MGGSPSQAEVKGQVGLAHLLSVHRVKLVVHRHCEDVLPKTHTTCRQDTEGGILKADKMFRYISTKPGHLPHKFRTALIETEKDYEKLTIMSKLDGMEATKMIIHAVQNAVLNLCS